MSLENKVIPIWLVVYDQNPHRSYLLFSPEKVLQAIDGVIRTTFSTSCDEICSRTLDVVKSGLDRCQKFTPICIERTVIFIHRLDIDKHSPVHKSLLSAYAKLSESDDEGDIDIAATIESLFTDQ